MAPQLTCLTIGLKALWKKETYNESIEVASLYKVNVEGQIWRRYLNHICISYAKKLTDTTMNFHYLNIMKQKVRPKFFRRLHKLFQVNPTSKECDGQVSSVGFENCIINVTLNNVVLF